MPALETLTATRIVATPAALDKAAWPPNTFPLRTAPDEILLLNVSAPISLPADEHAIIQPEGSYMGLWLSMNEALAFLERTCAWELPAVRPTLAQGAVANVPVKLWLEPERVLFIVQAPFAEDFETRLLGTQIDISYPRLSAFTRVQK